MSSEAEFPDGAVGSARSDPDATVTPIRPVNRPPGDDRALGDGQTAGHDRDPGVHGLFDPDQPLRSVGRPPPATVGAPQSQPRAFGGPILGSGPETGRHRKVIVDTPPRGGEMRAAPFTPSPPPVTLPTPPLERVLDGAHRWRTALGLGLAAVITVGVVVAYQRPSPDESLAGADGAGADSRSAIAAVTDFGDDSVPDGTASTVDGERQVNSAVDDDGGRVPTAPGADEPAGPAAVSTTSQRATTTSDPGSTTTSETATSTSDSTPTTDPSSTTETTLDQTTSTDTGPSTTAPTSPTSSSSSSTSTSEPTTTVPVVKVRIEAEAGTLLGAAEVRADAEGFSGSGFVADMAAQGDGASFIVTAAGGPMPFTVGYAAGPIPGPGSGLRTLSVMVNGVRVTEARMQPTGAWDRWDIIAGSLDLAPGENTITLIRGAGDDGRVAIDYIEIN